MLRIKQAVISAMLAHVTAVYPHEACGFLAGSGGLIDRIYPIPNVLHSRTAYRMEPKAQVAALLEIDAAGCTHLVIFHSHPDGTERPSPTDIAQAAYPTAVYLIISLAEHDQPAIHAYRIANGATDELLWEIV